jgi:hypothetical protein
MRYSFSAAYGLVAIFAATQVSAADLRGQVEGYRIAHEAQIIERLDDLIRIRSVAADRAGLAAAGLRLSKESGRQAHCSFLRSL